MKRCDICWKETDELVQLMDSYKTTQIKDVCDPCRKILDEHKSKLQTVTAKVLSCWLVEFIESLQKKLTAGAK